MKTSSEGIALIKNFEGCKLKAYRCSAGVLTIGYGHTGVDVKEGMVIDINCAEKLLSKDLERFEIAISKLVSNLNQSQFDAIVSFCFNLGVGNFTGSTLLKKIKANDFAGAANEFTKWNKANGKVLAGLTKRREAEKALFSRF